MAMLIEGAEGLNPSFEEVKSRQIGQNGRMPSKKESKNLKDNGTWTMVEWPAGANVVNSR